MRRRGFAQRLIQRASGTPEGRITMAFRMVLSHTPSAVEMEIVMEFFNRQLARYQAAPQDAAKAIRSGESLPAAGLDEPATAALDHGGRSRSEYGRSHRPQLIRHAR